MSRTLQIGSKIFTIPDAGDTAGWGEDSTEFLVAVADALASVQGPNDILLTSATLANNQAVVANIPGLILNLANSAKGAIVDVDIERIYNSGATTVSEYAQMLCSYNGTQLVVSMDSDGDTGILIDATNAGQFTYTSTNLVDHVSTIIKFKLKSIDN